MRVNIIVNIFVFSFAHSQFLAHVSGDAHARDFRKLTLWSYQRDS